MTKTEARQAVERWCRRNGTVPISRLRHVHARAVVVGYAAPGCLVVRLDSRESERHMIEWHRDNPLSIVRKFDHRLAEGDICAYAYVMSEGSGECVAVKLPAQRVTRRPGR